MIHARPRREHLYRCLLYCTGYLDLVFVGRRQLVQGGPSGRREAVVVLVLAELCTYENFGAGDHLVLGDLVAARALGHLAGASKPVETWETGKARGGGCGGWACKC